MSGKGTTDTLFVVRRMREEGRDEKKKFFADIKKAFNTAPKKVMERAARKRGLPEVTVTAVVGL